MIKQVILYLLLTCILLVSGCGLLDKDKEVTFKNPVYANVFFKKTLPNGAPVQGIIAINYDNPKEFKLLASDTSAYDNLRLSPDGEKLIYTDKYVTGLGSNPQYGMYRTAIRNKKLLLYKYSGHELLFIGNSSIGVVWNKENTGFYFTNPIQPFSGELSIFYFSLDSQKITLVRKIATHAIYPIDLISKDTLIVFSNEFNKLEFYLTGLDGEYLSKINNPYLYGINKEGITKRGVFDLAWNDSLRLMTAGYINGDEFDGYKVIVTDLEGTIFKEFTNGSYLNSNPTWTKDGNIIYTERRNLYNSQIESELKIIDLETGKIRSFFSNQEYPEITGIGTSDQ